MKVGNSERFLAKWKVDGSFVTSGSATIRFWRYASGAVQYLQADGVTFAATLASFAESASADAEGFERVLTIPAAAQGYTLNWEHRHSDGTLPLIGGSEYVTLNDDDTLATLINADAATVLEIRKLLKNRLRVNFSTSQLELYDDDDITLLHSWDLKDRNGNPIIAPTLTAGEILERLPVS